MALKKLTVNGTAWIDEIYEHSVALSSKYAPISHTHTKSQITDLDSVENATYAQTLGTASAGYTYSTLSSLLAGKSDTGHTHLYAGSSSEGGAATSANKLNTDAGSSTLPVYFSNGVPVAINTTGVAISITGSAKTADSAVIANSSKDSDAVDGYHILVMTQSEYASATKAVDTIYLIRE